MNKTSIKSFAARARNKLIEDITQKAYELGITKDEVKDIETFEGGFRIRGLENSRVYKRYEERQRQKLINHIRVKGFEQVIEEVSYTWFNRFIALRFMEINEYLPTGVRVLSSAEAGKTEPDIIKEALNIDLDLDKDIIYKFLDANDRDGLYKYLLIKQCNDLGQIMPMVFEKISDYTELLLPDNLLVEGSIIRDLVESIEEEDYKDQVEIIGWMYQYYISEKKDEVFASLKKNKKITKENIPAATQLFTPKWIVKYMVENSLGRLWLESHPDEDLKSQWKYYLEEAEQDPEVREKLDELESPNLNPEEIKILDPAMGSGHILVYAFDVLYDIYLKANYSERDIPQLILEKNLYGLDIDDRAGQLAAFALMMKARSKNRRIFRRKIKLNICSVKESNGLIENEEWRIESDFWDYLLGKDDFSRLRTQIEYLIEIFKDSKEYGSILEVKKIDFDIIERRIKEIRDEKVGDLFQLQYKDIILEILPPLIKQARIMSEKYDVVCTNPPYMGQKGMDIKLKSYIENKYKLTKTDIFSVFIEKGFEYLKPNGFNAMVTMQSWMFLSSFKKMREEIIMKKSIITMTHMGNMVMGIAFGTSATIFRNINITRYKGIYSFVGIENIENNEPREFPIVDKRYNICSIENFVRIPGNTIAYWCSEKMLESFDRNKALEEIAKPRVGQNTGDNNRFLKLWTEVDFEKITFGLKHSELETKKYKWIPYNKGGSYRKWYGNNYYLINWEDNGKEIKDYAVIRNKGKHWSRYIQNVENMCKSGTTWTFISSSKFAARFLPEGFICDVAGSAIFPNIKENNYILGFLNTEIAFSMLQIQNPTLNFQAGNIGALPFSEKILQNKKINDLVEENISISKKDWDSFETSWDFKCHPLVKKIDNVQCTIKEKYIAWEYFTKNQFNQLKNNEETLNKIIIDIYGLQDEFTPEVKNKDISISVGDREREIKSLISYGVGCMFGRYSLDEEGLIYAGGEFRDKFRIENGEVKINTKKGWKKSSVEVAMDNILVISEDDYFENDIVNRFVEFIKIAFGEKTLEENLDYIAETLDKKSNEASRQIIRKYFLKDFYNDHIKTYNKRPIYWLFDSGKQNGFKALIYIHRYDISTVARIRTDYLHTLQKKYQAEVKRLNTLIELDLSVREKAAVIKKKDIINKQIQECLSYDPIIAYIANQKISIDLDDGVQNNYSKFQDMKILQEEGKKVLNYNLLSKI